MKNALLFFFGSLILVSVACSKDDDNEPPPPPPTAVELVTSNTWRIDTMGIDANKDGTIDSPLPAQLDACDMDNTLTFSSDSTGVFSEGATKCDTADPDTRNIQWYLKNNDQTMYIDGLETDLDGDATIYTLTDSTLVLGKPVTVPILGGEVNLIVSLTE